MKKRFNATNNFGFVNGNTMSFFEACDSLYAMARSIEELPRDQIVAELQRFGCEPVGGFVKASKEQLADKLACKRVEGITLRMIFGTGYSN